jgi:hypothetical protein
MIVLLPILVPLLLLVLTLILPYAALLYLSVCLFWLPRGKNVLAIYSDSPIWHEYMSTQILPLVSDRAVVLNWSERKRWKRFSLAVLVFRFFAGRRDFNPMVIVFRPFRRAQKIRFWPAFQDWKRGYTMPVDQLRQRLIVLL